MATSGSCLYPETPVAANYAYKLHDFYRENYIINVSNNNDNNEYKHSMSRIVALQKENAGLRKHNMDMQKNNDRNLFTLVLIDGDAMNFHDDLVARGIPGGEEAAKRLLASVMDALRYKTDFRHGDPIVVRMYANIKNLGNTYVKYGLLDHYDEFADFVVGFNKIHPHVDFIDAGNAKGGADRKVLASFDRHLYQNQCRRIILGACSDGDFALHLRAIYDTNVEAKVTLLKGPPVAGAFQQFMHEYEALELPSVFRSEKLPHFAKGQFSPPRKYTSAAFETKRTWNRRDEGHETGQKMIKSY